MKRLAGLLIAVLLPSALPAQAAEHEAVAVVRRLFDAMRAQDTAAMRATMDPAARLLGTGTNQQGQPSARIVPVSGWLRGIGGARAKPDERIYDPELRVDQNLATVWTRYDFFSGENFSHCGHDSFHLVRTAGQWKIVQIADTQRRSAERCGRGAASAAETAPSAADTAAIVSALQKVFDGMKARDSLAIMDAFIPDALVVGVGENGYRPTPLNAWAGQIARGTGGIYNERMVKPEVRISDNLATVWTWYDFHIGERFSHCGFDAAQLALTTGGWKVAQITYTTQRTQCEAPKN